MVEGRIYSMRRMMSEVADIDPRVLTSPLYFLKMLRTRIKIKQNRIGRFTSYLQVTKFTLYNDNV